MLKKGDVVVMHTCGEAEHYAGKLWTCTTDERKLHEDHVDTVVWLEGFSGCFSTKFLQKVDLRDAMELTEKAERLEEENGQLKRRCVSNCIQD